MKGNSLYVAGGGQCAAASDVMAEHAVRRAAGAVAHRHHWSVYLVFASFSLLVAGLASDPRFQQMVREWFLSR